MAKQQEEEVAKKRSGKAKDVITTIGAEGEKGRKEAKKYFAEEIKKQEKGEKEDLDILDRKKGNLSTYNSLLADALIKRLGYVDWPLGWGATVAHTKKGVLMEVKAPSGKFYRAQFAPVRDPVYDLNAVDMYAVRAENTMDRVTGADQNGQSTKKGKTN